MEARRQWHDVFKFLKENCQKRILSPPKPYFKNEGKIKTFQDTQSFRKFIVSRPAV